MFCWLFCLIIVCFYAVYIQFLYMLPTGVIINDIIRRRSVPVCVWPCLRPRPGDVQFVCDLNRRRQLRARARGKESVRGCDTTGPIDLSTSPRPSTDPGQREQQSPVAGGKERVRVCDTTGPIDLSTSLMLSRCSRQSARGASSVSPPRPSTDPGQREHQSPVAGADPTYGIVTSSIGTVAAAKVAGRKHQCYPRSVQTLTHFCPEFQNGDGD